MRRVSIDKPNSDADHDMVETSSRRGTGYRPVPTSEGQPTSSRQSAPVYGSVKGSRSPVTTFLLVAFGLSLSLLLFAVIADMPVGDRLRAALFNSGGGGKTPSSELSKTAVSSLNSFGLQLFAKLATGDNADVVISPASIVSALSMAAAGTTEGSTASKELEKLLGEGIGSPAGSSDPSVELTVANGAWVAKGVLPSYVEEVKKEFGADVFPPPENPASVNDWVSKATKGKISSILDSVPGNLVALLINAVYFKGSWTVSFDPKDTKDASFYGPQGKDNSPEVTKVKMMRLTNEHFKYGKFPLVSNSRESVQVVELPYGKNNEFTSTIVVPTGKTTIGEIADLFKDGDTKLWDDWTSSVVSQKLDLMAMPRFKVEYGVKSLKPDLKGLGVVAAFESKSTDPQFLKLTNDKDAYLDDVLHKATLECTEEGTVASAATAAVVMTRSLPRENPKVILDRPFLFAIRNRVSGAILFMGRVDKPVSP